MLMTHPDQNPSPIETSSSNTLYQDKFEIKINRESFQKFIATSYSIAFFTPLMTASNHTHEDIWWLRTFLEYFFLLLTI